MLANVPSHYHVQGIKEMGARHVTWVGSGEKEGESFHVCFSAAQCWLGTVAEQGSAWSASTFIKDCAFVGLFLCCRTTVHVQRTQSVARGCTHFLKAYFKDDIFCDSTVRCDGLRRT